MIKNNTNFTSLLTGKEFSSGLKFSVKSEREWLPMDRISAILALVKDKKVIHLGCCDHVPLIKEKIKHGKWLHKLITENTKKCIGVDTDKEAIDFLKTEIGCENVVCNNILTDHISEIENEEWDVIVIGEVLEHIDNPIAFLTALRKKYPNNIKTLILTVPNAFSISNFTSCFKGYEYINTDHRYWFSPYTLSKILTLSGFTPEEFTFAQYGVTPRASSFKAWLALKLLRNKPVFRECLIYKADF